MSYFLETEPTPHMPLHRTISPVALLFSSVSAILGSGWLFSAYYTSELAGPAAIIAWLIGGVAVMFIAFIYAETSALLPLTGSSTRIPQFTHGTVVSFIFGWLIWLAYVSLVPAEVQAVIQYINYYYPNLTFATGALTRHGYIAAIFLMLVISAINVYSLRWLIRCNNILTIMKIVIPLLISVVILAAFFSKQHVFHPANQSFMPFGYHGVFAAIASGGIVFAFNGFKQACEMAGEAKNPFKTVPMAIIGSVALCLLIYLLLQSAFLASLNSKNLADGWHQLVLGTGTSPFADIAHQDKLSKTLLGLLYLGAIIGPLAAALMYAGSASRSLYGQSKNGYLPLFLQKLSTHETPYLAIIANFIFGMLLFAPLPGWDAIVSFLTSLMAITYAVAPICLLALRQQLPELDRPFKLPFATVWSTIAFYICTLFAYWSGWTVISKLGFALVIGVIVLFGYALFTERGKKIVFHWKASIWIWPYFTGLILFSYFGNFGNGRNIIPFGWDFVFIGIFCVFIVYLAIKFKLSPEMTRAYVHGTHESGQ